MPTPYPKCSPSELSGLVVLLDQHKGNEDVARLADDLDLEIDEILPAVEFAELLGLIQVSDGRASMTPVGTSYVRASIRARKTILRDQLKTTVLFRTIVRALDSSPDHYLTDSQLNDLVAFTNAPADDYVQNIINWGRYTELFRYDSNQHVVIPVKARTGKAGGAGGSPPAGEPPAEVPGRPVRGVGNAGQRDAAPNLSPA